MIASKKGKQNSKAALDSRLFVYRTVPELKFKFSSNNIKKKSFNLQKQVNQSFSQKNLLSEDDDKILFKTRNNILLKDYQVKSNETINHKSILGLRQKDAKLQSKAFNRVNTEMGDIKFHQVDLGNVSWQKWKKPYSIIRVNKHNLTQRQNANKRIRTQSGLKFNSEKYIQEIKNQMKLKKIERQISEIHRLKRYIQDKNKVIDLMKTIQNYQQESVSKTFQEFKEQVNEICDYYKNEKFEDSLT